MIFIYCLHENSCLDKFSVNISVHSKVLLLQSYIVEDIVAVKIMSIILLALQVILGVRNLNML